MRINNEEFLRYYWEELLYLRRLGQGFARSYPKIAGRLELQGDECPDPHVERLIESFAFLTARIQRDLDSDFPEIAAELLDVLYPHYLRTVPSMAIAASYRAFACFTSPSAPSPPFSPARELTMMPSQTSGSARPG